MAGDVVARLSKYLAASEPNASGWHDMYCPFHDDSTRSAGVNLENWTWSCRAGCGSGSLDHLLDRLDAMEEGESAEAPTWDDPDGVLNLAKERSKRRGTKKRTHPPTEEEVAEWQQSLFADDELVERFVSKRGLTRETMKEFEIGWHQQARGGRGAYTLPVRDSDGGLINARLYAPDGTKTTVWWLVGGGGANPLFPESSMSAQDILICEGEWDAMMALQNGFAAVTGTTGAMQWQRKWDHRFEGKSVTIIYDRDEVGVLGAGKVAAALAGVAKSVKIANLPYEVTEKRGKDLSDFFNEGATRDDFQEVLQSAERYSGDDSGEARLVSVAESFNPANKGKVVEMRASVAGKGMQVHMVPKKVAYHCNQNADKKCIGCPMNDADGSMSVTIRPSDPVVLAMRDVPTAKRDEALREHIGAHKCGLMEVDVREVYTTETLVVRTSVEEEIDDDGESAAKSRTVVHVGGYRTETNTLAAITGTIFPDPSSQEQVFQAWSVDQVDSSLDHWEPSDDQRKLMEMFRYRGSKPLARMGAIAKDMAANVTRIYGRPDLHIMLDLAWHSVIGFNFDGVAIDRGWLDVLILGDARTGKSEAATKLSRHYGVGRIVSCESASIPGILGAVKPMPGSSKSWTLEWGAIPLNDRRLVVLDEAGGLTPEQISQLSSLRSSGIAEIIKAEREQTRSRCRLVWISNPRSNHHGMGSYMYGVHSIPPLIGNQEDIARFDLAMTVHGSDVPSSAINTRSTDEVDHRYTAEACHAMVMWAWSRKPDQVEWLPEAEDLVYREAEVMGDEYVPDPPLVQAQNVRHKIARVAAAVAARTFSSPDGETLLVEPRHVDAALKFMRHLYNKDSFGYGEISAIDRRQRKEAAEAADEAAQYVYARPGLPRLLISSGGRFRRQHIEEQLNYAREEANLVITKLSQMNMIRPMGGQDYQIMPVLNAVLRDLTRRGKM